MENFCIPFTNVSPSYMALIQLLRQESNTALLISLVYYLNSTGFSICSLCQAPGLAPASMLHVVVFPWAPPVRIVPPDTFEEYWLVILLLVWDYLIEKYLASILQLEVFSVSAGGD